MLDERERHVVALRYGLENGQPLSLRETGKVLGLSGERVRLIERGAAEAPGLQPDRRGRAGRLTQRHLRLPLPCYQRDGCLARDLDLVADVGDAAGVPRVVAGGTLRDGGRRRPRGDHDALHVDVDLVLVGVGTGADLIEHVVLDLPSERSDASSSASYHS